MQKTAYGMRISDWSSDVCSSDLRRGHVGHCELMARPVLRDLERGGGAHHQCAVLLHGHAAAGKASSVIVARNGEIQPLVGQPRLSEKGMEADRKSVV